MLHPKAHEFGDVLVRLLFEGGDEIVQVKAAAAACVKHVTECGAEYLRTITILETVKKQNAFCSHNIVGFRLMRRRVRWNHAE
jgi:hypothetical protein